MTVQRSHAAIKISTGALLGAGLLVSLLTLAALLLAAPARAAVTITSFTAGSPSTQAGGHTDDSTAFSFEALADPIGQYRDRGGEPQNIVVTTPPGLVGDANNVPRCPRSLFSSNALELVSANSGVGGCPADTQVGIAALHYGEPAATGETTVGVYNVEPAPNEPALLGIEGFVGVSGLAIPIHLAVSPEHGYAVIATVEGVPRLPASVSTLGSAITLWGVPGAHTRHGAGGEEDEQLAPGPASQQRPFIVNPTDCGEQPTTSLAVNTYEEPNVFTDALAGSQAPTDCAAVPFVPSISLAPETSQAGAPTGVTFELTLPQNNIPNGTDSSEIAGVVVGLPAGLVVSPSAASGVLEGCSDAQFSVGSDVAAGCPAGSVIGEDEVFSPAVLAGPLRGRVFLGQPLSTDPTSGQMFRIFQELKGFGVDVKLQGSVVANPETGQLTARFEGLPQLPFERFVMRLKGGPNAVLVNPSGCGTHTTTSVLSPYSATAAATPSSTFTTSEEGGCSSQLGFSPSAAIQTANAQAGATSPLTVSFARADDTQPLGRIDATLPPGLLGYVSKVPLCEAGQALAGTCSAESRIGTVATSVGAGPDPLSVQGSVYLARGSNGYPFMLSVVVPAVAGPYDLGDVVVPVWLQVNNNASVTAVSGSLPSILDGIPLNMRSVTMTLDRPSFTLNPTSCGPLALTGTATSITGATAALSAPFSLSGCQNLPFAPSFTAATNGTTSKANGASLSVRITQQPGEANIRSVHVELPKTLPSRLSTLQQACTEAQFAANPAGCPPGSFVGSATAYTPLLSTPLSGPAIFVSHAGAAFPDLDIVLQGQGITITLVGNTYIKHAITSSTFTSVPDAPISGFQLNLPQGPYSILTATQPPCQEQLAMPTTITSQTGATIKQSTPIKTTNCPKPTIKITKTTTKNKTKTLQLTITTNTTATIKITAHGIKTTIKKNVKAGTSRIAVALSKAWRATSPRTAKLDLHASLELNGRTIATTARALPQGGTPR